VLLDNSKHPLAFLLGSPTCLFYQGLLTACELSSGEIFCLLLQQFHIHAVSSCRRAVSHAASADGSRTTGPDCGIAERRDAHRVLSPFHFSESAGDMGMLRIDLARSVKCGDRVSKLPRRQARVPVRKGLKR